MSSPFYASVNSTCAQLPPGQLRGIARLVGPGGGAFANFALPEGCKGMFSILHVCMHFVIAYQARIT